MTGDEVAEILDTEGYKVSFFEITENDGAVTIRPASGSSMGIDYWFTKMTVAFAGLAVSFTVTPDADWFVTVSKEVE